MDFSNDYELLYFVRQKCEFALHALFQKYEKMLWSIIHQNVRYYSRDLISLDEFMQHARIAFYLSIDQYREDRSASFSTFMYTCIDRKIRTLMRDMFRGNSMFHLDCISMDQEILSAENITLIDTVENFYPEYCPVWNFRMQEEEAAFNKILSLTKEEEQKIFKMWRDGFSYAEIAQALDVDTKSVDNAIQKIRKLKNRHRSN